MLGGAVDLGDHDARHCERVAPGLGEVLDRSDSVSEPDRAEQLGMGREDGPAGREDRELGGRTHGWWAVDQDNVVVRGQSRLVQSLPQAQVGGRGLLVRDLLQRRAWRRHDVNRSSRYERSPPSFQDRVVSGCHGSVARCAARAMMLGSVGYLIRSAIDTGVLRSRSGAGEDRHTAVGVGVDDQDLHADVR